MSAINNKRIITSVVCVFLCVTIISCKKEFNLPPNDELSWSEVNKTTSNLDGIINAGYGRLMISPPATAQQSTAFDHILYSEAMGGGRLLFPLNLTATQNTSLLFNFSMLADNALLGRLSRNIYSTAAVANNVIYFINNDPPKDNEFAIQKTRLEGEAKFLRALSFFYAVKYWGHQFGFNSNSPNSGIMIPLNPSTDGTAGVGRSTVQEAYQQIIGDLNDAIALLPVSYDQNLHAAYPSYRFRATKAAALALLARVYFQQGTPASYQLALNTINRVIGSTPGTITATTETGVRVYSLQADVKIPFNQTGFNAPANNTEEILRLVNNNVAQQGYNTASLNLTNESGGNPIQRAAARWFLNRPTPNPTPATPVTTSPLFDDVINDRRFTELTFNNDFTGANAPRNQRVSSKWGFMTGTSIGMQNCPLFRAAELVITRAEINAILNNTSAALADYNLIRRRAITGYVDRTLTHPSIGNTQAGLILEICRERQRELLFEGDDFWSWKRMNAYNNVAGIIYPLTMTAPLTRGTQTFNWNSNRTLLKFSIDDLAGSSLLGLGAQNPD